MIEFKSDFAKKGILVYVTHLKIPVRKIKVLVTNFSFHVKLILSQAVFRKTK